MTGQGVGRPGSATVRGSGEVAWHAAPPDEVLGRLESRPEGLTAVEAERRLAEHGPNALTRHGGPSAWQVLVRQLTSPLIYALLASAAVAFALGDVPDAAVVLAVVVLNAVIGSCRSTGPARRSRRWRSWCPSRRPCAATGGGRRSWRRPSCRATWCRSRRGRGWWPTCESCTRAGCARTRRR